MCISEACLRKPRNFRQTTLFEWVKERQGQRSTQPLALNLELQAQCPRCKGGHQTTFDEFIGKGPKKDEMPNPDGLGPSLWKSRRMNRKKGKSRRRLNCTYQAAKAGQQRRAENE